MKEDAEMHFQSLGDKSRKSNTTPGTEY